MAVVTVLTADKTLELVNLSVVSGLINASGHLILTTYAGVQIDAGYALLAVPDASDIIKGVVELATNAETITGTDILRAVTPAGLASRIAAIPADPDASVTVKGIVELATDVETNAGTDTVRAITPSNLTSRLAAFFTRLKTVASDAGRAASPPVAEQYWRSDKSDTELWDGTNWIPGGLNRPYALLGRSTGQSVPDIATTAVGFSTHSADSHGGHSTTVNNSRYTPTIPGVYDISCSIPFGNQIGIRELTFRVSNASGIVASYTGHRLHTSSAVATVLAATRKIPILSGQWVEAMVWHSTGAALVIDNAYASGANMDIMWLRPV